MTVLAMAHNNNNNNNNNNNSSSSKEGGNGKPIFHDFFGVSPVEVVPKQSIYFHGDIRLSEASASVGASFGWGHGPLSTTSDLGSERHMGNHFEGAVQGFRSEFSVTEISNRFQGRKRSNLDSMGSTRDMMPQIGLEFLDSPLMKKLRSTEGGERQRSHEEGMQASRLTSTTPHMLQPPISRRPDPIASKLELSIQMNSRPTVQHPPSLGQFATYVDKVSSNRYMDVNGLPSVISHPAADEGSRTGIKGPGILNAINASSGDSEWNSSGVLLSSCRSKSGPQTVDPESSNPPSQHGLMSPCRQMTIFYAGQAHVFDDVHTKKADAIMALAGSNGGSWSTSYSPKPSVLPPLCETSLRNGENEVDISNLANPQQLRAMPSKSGPHQDRIVVSDTRHPT